MDTNTPPPVRMSASMSPKRTWISPSGGMRPPSGSPIRPRRWQALLVRLQGLSVVQVIVEATGGLELRLMTELWAAQIAVARINPKRVRAFAKASGQLAKTDALDARLLAQFGAALRPAATPLPAADTQALAALVGRRRQLVDMRTMEHNRLLSATQTLQPGIQKHVAWLDDEIAALEHDISDFIQAHTRLGCQGRRAGECAGHRPDHGPHSLGCPARVGRRGSQEARSAGRRGAFQSR